MYNIVGALSADRVFPENDRDLLHRCGIHQRDERFFRTAAPSHGGVALIDDKNGIKRHEDPQTDNADVKYHRKIEHPHHLFSIVASIGFRYLFIIHDTLFGKKSQPYTNT